MFHFRSQHYCYLHYDHYDVLIIINIHCYVSDIDLDLDPPRNSHSGIWSSISKAKIATILVSGLIPVLNMPAYFLFSVREHQTENGANNTVFTVRFSISYEQVI